MWIWSSVPLKLSSTLSPEECFSRLSAQIEPDSWFKLTKMERKDSKPLVGQLSGSKLYIKKRLFSRRAFQKVLEAELIPLPNGTELQGVFRTQKFGRVVGLVGVLFWCLIALGTSISLIRSFLGNEPMGQFAIFSAIARILCLVMIPFCFWLESFLSRNGPPFITELLHEVLEATEINEPLE